MDNTQKRGNLVPVSPSHTPRSTDKSVRSNESGISSSTIKNDKGVNVQVILRCRPLSEEESRTSTQSVITCNGSRREVAALQIVGNKQIDKTFTFDRVFGPASKQKDLFDQAVSPIINEVLDGYNCTIFAYGQTGTGKTYTMEGGGRKSKNGDFPNDAGVIPRSVRRIFDILEAQHAEYSMKVTFLELYNEEITDLLAADEPRFPDDKTKKPIALMEDGKGGVFVRGLEEEIVYSANEIYKILDKGSAKRRTAETLLNKQSSRSHSIFSVTIHIKECTPEGEEMIKCGKLNLVDLAGSENISRSGARDGRAREAGEINKSLLTLGRVINALVEHSGHVPYRDSKLTRLLRDSLGGRTKTCIIATISPSIHCLEETLSTLDYAHRAKNIKNKPEINQKMMKSAVMKDLYSEIERLKQEVHAAREKNGIYIPRERYLQEESEKKVMTQNIERLELELESKDKQLLGIQEQYNSLKLLSDELSGNLEKTQKKLEETENDLLDLEQKFKQANCTIREKDYLISNLLNSEKLLVERAYELRSDLANAAADVSGLFSKIEHKDKIEEANKILVQRFRIQLTNQLDILHNTVSASATQQEYRLKEMEDDMKSFLSMKSEATEELQGHIAKLKKLYCSGIRSFDSLAGELTNNSQLTLEELNSQVSDHSVALEKCFEGIVMEAEQLFSELQSSLSEQEDKLVTFAKQQHEGHLRALEATRSMSCITTSFFQTVEAHATKLRKMLEETQAEHGKQLHDLEKKFEESAAKEEQQLLEKVTSLLASSNARNKKLVQEAASGLHEYAADRINNLQEEISNACQLTFTVKGQWTSFINESENNYREANSATDKGRCLLEEGLQECKEKTTLGSQQWLKAQEYFVGLENSNKTSVESIIRSTKERNQLLRDKLSSSAAATLQDADVANEIILSSIKRSLKLDQDACTNLESQIVPSIGDIRTLQSGHYHKTVEIREHAHNYLEKEYVVDEPSCSTPRKSPINVPSELSIEELKTPAFEELLKSFHESKSTSKQQANGDAKHFSGSHESQAHALRDSRAPLTAIN